MIECAHPTQMAETGASRGPIRGRAPVHVNPSIAALCDVEGPPRPFKGNNATCSLRVDLARLSRIRIDKLPLAFGVHKQARLPSTSGPSQGTC